jgi:cell division inhibitor SepF
MASMWRKAMLYLGLGPDEDYDDYEVLGGGGPAVPPARDPVRRPAMGQPRERISPDTGPTSAVRTLGPNSVGDGSGHHGRASQTNGHSPRQSERSDRGERGDRPDRDRDRPGSSGRGRSGVVRPLSVVSAKPHVVAPASFTDAQEVADEFKRNVPVIVNLQGVERDLMRRIIDFSSGLCYGLSGQKERVANHVYLLTPSDVEVAPEERRRWRDRHDDS